MAVNTEGVSLSGKWSVGATLGQHLLFTLGGQVRTKDQRRRNAPKHPLIHFIALCAHLKEHKPLIAVKGRV